MRINKIALTVAAMLAGSTLLGACGGTAATSSNTPAAGSNRPSASAPSASSSEAPAEAPEPDPQEGVKGFGETFTFEDGLAVMVTGPKKFTPSEYAATGNAKHNVVLTVTVVNHTGKAYDPGLFTASMQSANVEAEEIFDTENSLDGSPSTKVLNGREAKFKVGFNVEDPKDLVLEVAPGFEYNSVIYTNSK